MKHSIRWFVYVDGKRIPRTATMRGTWGYDAVCSCGWDSKTGGAVESYVRNAVADHKWDVDPEGERAKAQAAIERAREDAAQRSANVASMIAEHEARMAEIRAGRV